MRRFKGKMDILVQMKVPEQVEQESEKIRVNSGLCKNARLIQNLNYFVSQFF